MSAPDSESRLLNEALGDDPVARLCALFEIFAKADLEANQLALILRGLQSKYAGTVIDKDLAAVSEMADVAALRIGRHSQALCSNTLSPVAANEPATLSIH